MKREREPSPKGWGGGLVPKKTRIELVRCRSGSPREIKGMGPGPRQHCPVRDCCATRQHVWRSVGRDSSSLLRSDTLPQPAMFWFKGGLGGWGGTNPHTLGGEVLGPPTQTPSLPPHPFVQSGAQAMAGTWMGGNVCKRTTLSRCSITNFQINEKFKFIVLLLSFFVNFYPAIAPVPVPPPQIL